MDRILWKPKYFEHLPTYLTQEFYKVHYVLYIIWNDSRKFWLLQQCNVGYNFFNHECRSQLLRFIIRMFISADSNKLPPLLMTREVTFKWLSQFKGGKIYFQLRGRSTWSKINFKVNGLSFYCCVHQIFMLHFPLTSDASIEVSVDLFEPAVAETYLDKFWYMTT